MTTPQEIITRQKAEIKDLKLNLKKQIKLVEFYKNHYEASQEALEQFKNGLQVTQDYSAQFDAMNSDVNKLKAKYQRLKDRYDNVKGDLDFTRMSLVDINDFIAMAIKHTPKEVDFILRNIMLANMTSLRITGKQNGTKD